MDCKLDCHTNTSEPKFSTLVLAVTNKCLLEKNPKSSEKTDAPLHCSEKTGTALLKEFKSTHTSSNGEDLIIAVTNIVVQA